VIPPLNHPLAHLGGSLIGERDCENLVRRHVAIPNDMTDPASQYAGLTGTSTSHD